MAKMPDKTALQPSVPQPSRAISRTDVSGFQQGANIQPLEGVKQGAERSGAMLFQHQQRIKARADLVSSSNLVDEMNSFTQESLLTSMVDQDWSDPATGKWYADALKQKETELLQSFQGSEDAKAMLTRDLAGVRAAGMSRATILGHRTQLEAIKGNISKHIASLEEQAFEDPTKVFDLATGATDYVKRYEKGMTPEIYDESMSQIQNIYQAAIFGHLVNGETEEAQALAEKASDFMDWSTTAIAIAKVEAQKKRAVKAGTDLDNDIALLTQMYGPNFRMTHPEVWKGVLDKHNKELIGAADPAAPPKPKYVQDVVNRNYEAVVTGAATPAQSLESLEAIQGNTGWRTARDENGYTVMMFDTPTDAQIWMMEAMGFKYNAAAQTEPGSRAWISQAAMDMDQFLTQQQGGPTVQQPEPQQGIPSRVGPRAEFSGGGIPGQRISEPQAEPQIAQGSFDPETGSSGRGPSDKTYYEHAKNSFGLVQRGLGALAETPGVPLGGETGLAAKKSKESLERAFQGLVDLIEKEGGGDRLKQRYEMIVGAYEDFKGRAFTNWQAYLGSLIDIHDQLVEMRNDANDALEKGRNLPAKTRQRYTNTVQFIDNFLNSYGLPPRVFAATDEGDRVTIDDFIKQLDDLGVEPGDEFILINRYGNPNSYVRPPDDELRERMGNR